MKPDKATGIQYITSIKSSLSLWFIDATLSNLCVLLLACLQNTASHQLIQQDREAYQLANDPIKLLLLSTSKTESSALLNKIKIKIQDSLIAVLNDMGMDSQSAKEYLKAKQKSIAIMLNHCY